MSSQIAGKKQVEQPVFPEREPIFPQNKPGPSRKCSAEAEAAIGTSRMQPKVKVKVTRLQNTESPQKVPPQAGE